MDRIDFLYKKNQIKGNLVKWWNVNMVEPEADNNDVNAAKEEPDINLSPRESDEINLSNEEQSRINMILRQNSNVDAFDKAMDSYNQSKIDEANEIYERLMREAAEDEAKKQDEIEKAKAQNI